MPYDFTEELAPYFGLGSSKKKKAEEPKKTKFVSSVLDSELKRQYDKRNIPNPQQFETTVAGDAARAVGRGALSALDLGQRGVAKVAETVQKSTTPILLPGGKTSGREIMQGVYSGLDALDSLRGGTQAAAFEVADTMDEKSALDTAKGAAKAGVKAISRTMQGVPEPGFSEALAERGVEMPGWKGLLADLALDPTNVIPGKALAAGVVALPMKLGKLGKAAEAAADVVKVAGPNKTVKAYKLFRVDPNQPGKLFPLFVDANNPVPLNEWVKATEGPATASGKVKSKLGELAYRPGWHAGDAPVATHIGGKTPGAKLPDYRPENQVWAEVELADDVDWQTVANERGLNPEGRVVPVKAHITDQIPFGGHYRYKTNPNMTGDWLISGDMRVNRVLDDAEVAAINEARGLADLPRQAPVDLRKLGFRQADEAAPVADDLDGMTDEDAAIFDDLAAQMGFDSRTGDALDIDMDEAYAPLTNNASSESAASVEAINRQNSMKAGGQQLVVRTPSGKDRVLIGPEAWDYKPRPGETFGVKNADGSFQPLSKGERQALRRYWNETGNISPALALNLGATVGGGLAGAAANADSDIMPGGALTGALAGAAGGGILARGVSKVARGGARAAAIANAAAVPPQQVAEELASAQPTIERLITKVPERPEALAANPRRGKVSDTSYADNTAKRLEDEQRTQAFLQNHIGLSNAGERAVVTKILQNGEDYLFYKQRRMHVPEPDPVTGRVDVRSRSWQDDTAESWKLIWEKVKVPRGTTLNPAQMESLERKVRGITERMSDMADDAAQAQAHLQAGRIADAEALHAKWGVHSQEALEILADQAAEEAMIGWRSVTGVRSELGRSLNSLKKKIAYRNVAASDDEFIKRAAQMGVEGKEIRSHLHTLKTPEQRYKYLRDRATVTDGDLFKWYYISSLLSGPKTHARNLTSNLVNMATMDVGYLAGRGTDVLRGRVSATDFANEAKAMLHGQRVGIIEGFKNAREVFRNGFTVEDAQTFAEKPPEIKMSRLIGTSRFDSERSTRWLNAVSRFLEATDQAARTVAFSGALHAGAYKHASRLLREGKITQADFAKTIDNIIRDPHVVAPDVFDEARKFAQDAVYRQDSNKFLQKMTGALGAIDEAGQKYIGGAVGKIKPKPLRVAAAIATAPLQNVGTLVAPFVKTPANVFAKQFRYMGGGMVTAKAEREAGRDIMAAVKQGEGMLGALGLVALSAIAMNSDRPLITGVGPNDPSLKDDPTKALDAFYGSNRPMSIRIPGSDTWIDYRALGPVAGILSVAGNMSDAYRQGGGKLTTGVFADAAARQVRAMASNSFLTGIMGVFSALEDRSGVSVNRTVGRTAAGLLPASGLLRTARTATDPVIRDTRDETLPGAVWQNVKNTLPGLSQVDVPARVDYAGNTLRSPMGTLGRMFSPSEIGRVPEDQTRKELAALGAEAYLTKPPKELKDEIGNPMDLTKLQSTELQKAVGVAQYEIAKALLAQPGFRDLPADERASMLREMMAEARDAAKDNYRDYVRSLSTAKP